MSSMTYRLYRNLVYQFRLIGYHIVYGHLYDMAYRFKIRMRFNYIWWRLIHEGNSKEYSLNVLRRYSLVLKYREGKETKESLNKLYDYIARISDATGIPQWEIRARIQSDFKLDV